jgi:hypothetical protein
MYDSISSRHTTSFIAQMQSEAQQVHRPVETPVEPRQSRLLQALFLVLALAAYTFGPLLVNWSVMVPNPVQAYRTTVHVPPGGGQSLGIKYDYKAGVLFVLDAPRHPKLLHGDSVAFGMQGGETVFDLECLQASPKILAAVKTYLENGRVRAMLEPTTGPCRGVDPSQPLTVSFDLAGVVAQAGQPNLPVSIIVCWKFVGCVIFAGFTAAVHGVGYVRKNVINVHMLRIMLLPALGWASGDICEILANSKLDAALYSILSQTRLMGTAAFMYMYLGHKQTTLQMSLLFSLSLLIFVYLQMPDYVPLGHIWNGFGKPRDPLNPVVRGRDDAVAVLYAFMKIFFSIVSGVLGQRALQDETMKELPLYALQAGVFLTVCMVTLPATLIFLFGTGWEHGFFGGEDVVFWHCGDNAVADGDCLENHRVAQGWDRRTVAVMCFYIYRETAINLVLRRFNAIVKNLVNAGATFATYFLSLLLFGTQFNVTKFGLVLCVIQGIYQYSLAPPPPKSEFDVGREVLARSPTCSRVADMLYEENTPRSPREGRTFTYNSASSYDTPGGQARGLELSASLLSAHSNGNLAATYKQNGSAQRHLSPAQGSLDSATTATTPTTSHRDPRVVPKTRA